MRKKRRPQLTPDRRSAHRQWSADGTPYPGCFAPGGSGAGATAEVAAGGRAVILCTRTIAPLLLRGLRVTARIEAVRVIESRPSAAAQATDVMLARASAALFGK